MSIFEDIGGMDPSLTSIRDAGSSPLLMNGGLASANPDLIEPFVSGYNFISWFKLPGFFDGDTRAAYRAYTERNLKSLDLYNDFEMETGSVNYGFHGASYEVATNLRRDIQRITTGHNEFWSLPVSRLTEKWVTGIRDPETGMAHYHGQLINNDLIEYKPSYHCGSMITWVTDPAGKGLVRAALLVNMFPLPVKLSHLNMSSGDHSTTDMSISCSCIYHESRYINAIAKAINSIIPANKQQAAAWGSTIYEAMVSNPDSLADKENGFGYLFDEDWASFGVEHQNGLDGESPDHQRIISAIGS
jgi:hypothetical protein